MVQTLFTRPRAIFAIFMAIGAASLTLVAIERSGDPQAVVSKVERQINAIDAILVRHTYVAKNSDSQKPDDNARVRYKLRDPKGEISFVDGPFNPNTSEVERIVGRLYLTEDKQYVSLDSAWSEVQTIWANLTWRNRQAAEARALLQFDSKPASTSSYDWDNRFRRSKDQWQVQENAEFRFQRALYTAGALFGAFIATLVTLVLMGWLWRAMLARIRELSNAIRGKEV